MLKIFAAAQPVCHSAASLWRLRAPPASAAAATVLVRVPRQQCGVAALPPGGRLCHPHVGEGSLERGVVCEGPGACAGGGGGFGRCRGRRATGAAARGPLAPLSPAARGGTALGMRNRHAGSGVGA